MASSSSSLPHSVVHHVFLSFRGPDVRKGFLSHALKELRSKGIIVFIDNEIKKGKSISQELVKAIRQSRVALVFLSRNYASSRWCLDELVEIIKCMKEYQQTVLAIYYDVNPTDVRHQKGDFGNAFEETCVGKTEEVKQAWRQALEAVAGVLGYHFSNGVSEADLISKVASDVMDVLGFTPSKDFDDFVGIGDRITEIKSMLVLLSEEVKVIGIFGPAGIGKTTTARVLYDKLSPDFQFSTFLENIGGSYKKPRGNTYELKLSLHKNMLCQIFNKGDIEVRHLGRAQEMLSDKKVLVVFDGVDNWWQLEEMAKHRGWVGPGSMIIITTEDRELLKALGLGSDHIFEMKFPGISEAFDIFCQYAFYQKSPDHGFESLAWEVSRLAGNLPLGLRVMGSYLRGKSMDEWIEALPWLRSTLDREIESTLRCSYDALRDNERTIFLHLACLFAGFRVDSFKRYFANSSLVVNYGLEVLAQKSLIYIEHGFVKMHRLLQQMGREIVNKQYMENPAKPHFLTDSKEISDLLDDDTAAIGNVRGITLDTSEKIRLSKSAFQRLNSLRFLYVDSNTIRTPEGLDCFPDKLKLLRWKFCPLRFWPSKFSGKFLVELIMQFSKFEMLWDGIKPLSCLKKLDLSYSYNLKKIPDLSEATSLEELYLEQSGSLLEITSSIANATKLYRLDIRRCSKINDFPNVPDSIVELDLCYTGIKEVPPWIENLYHLRKLIMYGCEKLQTISPNISKLENLEFLHLSNYDHDTLNYYDEVEYDTYEDDEEVYRFGSFEAIIEWGPDYKRSWRLRSDFKVHYILLICLPEKAFTSPISLGLHNSGIKTIPDCIRRLSRLIKLDVKGSIDLVALPLLPDSLLSIDAQGCTSLKTIDSSFQNLNICLNFADCVNLEQKARNLIQTSACKYAVLPGEEVPAHFTHRASSGSLTINLTPRPLPSSFRFKACILLSKVYYFLGDTKDDDDEEGENILAGMSYSVRGKQNGFRVGGGSNQIHMPDLYGYGKHLYIFEDNVSLNQDFPEAEEPTFNELTFVFRFHDNFWKISGCGVLILGANNESAGGEDDGVDEDEDEEDDDDDDDDDDDEDDDYDDSGDGGEEDDDEGSEDGEDDDDYHGNTEPNNETEGE